MSLQFILGGSGSGKSEYVQNLAIKIALEDRSNNVLMVVPDQFTMQTQWQMALRHPDGGIINIDVLSFSRLPRRVFEEVGQPKRMLLDDTGKCLLIKRGATKVKDKLHVLSKGMDNAGWSGEVKSVLSEFMQYNVKPDDLDRVIGDCSSDLLKRKLEDLKLLYEVFLKECEEKYITREEILDLFIERLPLSKKIEKSIVIFDGFTGFTPIQIKAVVAILKKAKDVIITLPFDNDLSENPFGFSDEENDFCLFDLTKRNIRDLLIACQDEGIEVLKEVRLTEDYRHKDNPELAHIEKYLFRKKHEKIKAGGAVTINKCGDIENECHNLCEALIKEIKEKNYRYSDMALICADMEKYKKPLAKYLDRYNIPYYMDENRSVINNPLVKYILSITDIIRNNFKVEDVLKMLRTGIAPFSDEEIDVLENYVYARGIKGINKWKNEFVYLSQEQRDNGEKLDEINALRERFISIFEDITKDGLKKKKLSAWIEELFNILEKTEVSERLSSLSEELQSKGLIVEAKEYEGVYNKVIEVFDCLTDLMGDEDYKVKELSDILKVGFSEIRVGVLPQKVDSLLVGDMQRTRLKETKALFIVGVNDGNIPKSGASGGLLSVPDKEELKNADCYLSPTSDELAFIEQLYIYLTLTKPTDKLYLSFATIGGKGDSLIPSYLIDTVIKMFEGLKDENVSEARPQINIADYKEEAARLLGRYISGLTKDSDEEDRLFDTIAKIRATENGKEWCEKVIENTFKEYIPTPLERETAKALYSDLLRVSVSTLEQFARCRFAHFAIYGLGLSEREEYGLENVDMGNMSHDVLEKVGEALKDKGLDFSTNETEMLEREIDLAVERIANEYNGDILQSDEKTKYYSKQLARIMKRTAKTLGYQLSKGRFKPEMYEEFFERHYSIGSLPSDIKGVSLLGRIDRADIYEDKAGNEYVKIMDYKSSAKSIDPKSIEEGLSLQLAIYMRNAIAILQERHPDKKVLPAAMLYYEIKDPFVESRENVEEEILKDSLPNGAIVREEEILTSLDNSLLEAGAKSLAIRASRKKDNDFGKSNNLYTAEEFETLLKNAEDKAIELSKDILLGSIDINPYEEKNKNACQYCSLKGVCGFDTKIKGYAFRNLEDEEE